MFAEINIKLFLEIIPDVKEERTKKSIFGKGCKNESALFSFSIDIFMDAFCFL